MEPPIHARPRRLSSNKLIIACYEFNKILNMGIIRRSASSWASPLVAASIAFSIRHKLNPVSLVYRIAYVCFVSMFPYLVLFLARLALY